MSWLIHLTFTRLTYVSFPLVLVSGWSDNGWLSGGHAVRMAMELCKQGI